MMLVEELQAGYRRRSREISTLFDQQDCKGILRRRERVRDALLPHLIDADMQAGALEQVYVGTMDFDGYSLEKFHIAGSCGNRIPMHLYLPEDGRAEHPAVLVLMGHWMQGKSMENNQIFCANLAKRGIVALTYDPLFQGERNCFTSAELEEVFGSQSEDIWAVDLHMFAGNLAYMLKKNLAALFMFEAQRALDWLCERQEVDAACIGVIGQSGGGTQSCYLAGLDERISFYVPVQCLTRLETKLPQGIDDCEQSLYGISKAGGFEHSDLLWAAMPKPLLHSAGKFDFFGIEGAYAVRDEMRSVYQLLGHEENYIMEALPCGHDLTREVRESIYAWLCRHLGLSAEAQEYSVLTSSGERLSCLEGRSAGWPCAVYQKQLSAWIARRPKCLCEQKRLVEELLGQTMDAYTVEMLADTATQRLFHIHTAKNRSAFCRLQVGTNKRLAVVVAPAEVCLKTPSSVLYITPWAMETAYGKKKAGYDAETCMFNAAAVLGQNPIVWRVCEIRAAIDWIGRENRYSKVTVVGMDAGALPVLLAAIAEPRVDGVILSDFQVSYDDLFEQEGYYYIQETNILPGLAEIADIPELCRMVDAVVLNPLTPARRRYTSDETARETRVNCRLEEDSQRAIARLLA